jgi:MraZ protein
VPASGKSQRPRGSRGQEAAPLGAVFHGEFEHAIDGKGRTSLPARFRDLIAPKGRGALVATAALEKCLWLFPPGEWNAFLAKLEQRPRFDRARELATRVFVAPAHECEVDGTGRILVPPPLRAHAGLDKDVVWVGQVNILELWDRDRWSRASRDARSKLEQERQLLEGVL